MNTLDVTSLFVCSLFCLRTDETQVPEFSFGDSGQEGAVGEGRRLGRARGAPLGIFAGDHSYSVQIFQSQAGVLQGGCTPGVPPAPFNVPLVF